MTAFYADLLHWKSIQMYFYDMVHRQNLASSSSQTSFDLAQMAAPPFQSDCSASSADNDTEMSRLEQNDSPEPDYC